MCGIVGYLGPQDPKTIIMSGLKKLEYRGYDSAGVAILDSGKLKRIRAEGKLFNLEKKLESENFNGHLGIGHTRWATHGVPSEKNAHPHQVGGISLVHNGIIENYLEIRDELVQNGAHITSDTDSELVAHLINDEIKKTKDLFLAVQKIIAKLKGAFSILVIWDQNPNEIVAFKDGPPLIVGLGNKENFVVSDVQAALNYTKKFIYLDDRQIAKVNTDSVQVFNVNGDEIQVEAVELNWNSEQIEKLGYSHFMLKEIYEQPQSISSAISKHINLEKESIELFKVGFSNQPQEIESLNQDADWRETQKVLEKIERIIVVACGTSYYSGLIAKYYIESFSRIPVEVDVASEFRYRNPIILPNTLVLSISQSGETADTLAAIRLVKEKKALTLSLCNVKNSSIDREAYGHLYMNAGPEIGVASTKAFTCTVAVLHCLALALGRIKSKLSIEIEKDQVRALLALPSQIEAALAYDKYFTMAAEELKKFRGFLYLGRGVNFPIALEGALKLKELAYYHAEGYASGEMKHGPLALIDEQMAVVVVAPTDELFEKTVSNLEEAKARGGQIIAVGSGDNPRLKSVSHRYLPIPKANWSTNPIISVIPLQLMAFHLASSLGFDVDQPRNLAKSVTVE